MEDFVPLNDVQLAYARAVSLLERHCDLHRDDDAYVGVETVKDKLERLGNLNSASHWQWRYKTPLHLLHDFSTDEQNLLLDLYDAGGTIKGRTFDRRFSYLGCGTGGKGAVMQSSQGNTCTTKLTDRGTELVKRWLADDAVRPLLADRAGEEWPIRRAG